MLAKLRGARMNKPDNNMLGDEDIRPALRSHLLAKHAPEAETVVLEELGICCGQVRVDLAVVNGSNGWSDPLWVLNQAFCGW
jgi:hypothetical protein